MKYAILVVIYMALTGAAFVYANKSNEIKVVRQLPYKGQQTYGIIFPDGKALDNLTADELAEGLVTNQYNYK